jgi:Flp pilus assembly protein TadD
MKTNTVSDDADVTMPSMLVRFDAPCRWLSRLGTIAMVMSIATLGACAHPDGYGVSDAALVQQAQERAQEKQEKPDSAKVYLSLIEQMQGKGLYYASLAHLDEYEHQYGISPHTTLLRADGLRMTDQWEPSALAYGALLNTPLAAQGYRGLGLLAGGRGDFAGAAQQLERAVAVNPTDAPTLSDLAYARLREGDLANARIPIMKAAELDQKNPKILSNLAIYLLADGQAKNANGLMDSQNMPRDVRDAVRKDAAAVGTAARVWDKRSVSLTQQGVRNE